MKRYVYKEEKFNSEYSLRQAIFKHERIAFGKLTPEFMKAHGIVEEEYNPEDELTDEQRADRIRRQRDYLLAQTDYLVMPDYPVDAETLTAVKAYRQELRDITSQKTFPKSVTWPEVPAVLQEKNGAK